MEKFETAPTDTKKRRTEHPVMKFLALLALTALSAFISSMAFPSFLSDTGWGFVSFFSLILMFYVIDRSSWSYIWLNGMVYGFLYYLIYNYWLKTFHPLAILIAPVLESVQYMILFPVLKSATSLFKKRGYILQSIFYTAYLYLTQQGFLAYPYGNISAALYDWPLLIQSADIFGIWGICLFLSLYQSMLAEAMSKELKARSYFEDIVIFIAVFAVNLGYGAWALKRYDPDNAGDTIRIAAVQHSADTWKGGYSQYKSNFETLTRLTDEAMEDDPEMVVWSETAFVPSVAWHSKYPSSWRTSRLCDAFVEYGKELPVPLVTGNPEGVLEDPSRPPMNDDNTWNRVDYNTVIYFRDGKIGGTYRKQHLVPFTEHFPYQEQMPRLTALLIANDYNWWLEGDQSTVFDHDGIRFSTPICFEDIFGSLNADFVRNGADMLINLANDSWSGSVAAEMQHMQLALFRAVENRVPLLRSTNSGITCMITPDGKVHDILPPFEEAWGIYELPLYLKDGNTFYTENPDLLAKIAVMLGPLGFIIGIMETKRRRREKWLSELPWQVFEHMDESVEC